MVEGAYTMSILLLFDNFLSLQGSFDFKKVKRWTRESKSSMVKDKQWGWLLQVPTEVKNSVQVFYYFISLLYSVVETSH